MAVEFLDPLRREERLNNIPGGIFWLNLVVLSLRSGRIVIPLNNFHKIQWPYLHLDSLNPLGDGGNTYTQTHVYISTYIYLYLYLYLDLYLYL